MVQLSSPTVEMIPVQKGPSPEKNSAPKSGDNGFKTAFREQKEIHESREAEKNTSAVSADQQKSEQAEDKKAEQSNTSKADFSKKTAGAESDHSDKTADVKEESSALKLVKTNTQKKIIKLSAKAADDSGKDGQTSSLEKNAAALLSASDQKSAAGIGSALQGADLNAAAADADASAADTALDEISEELKTALSFDQKAVNELSDGTSKAAVSMVQQNDSGKETDKSSRNRAQLKSGKESSDLKITVDDRRTVQERTPILKEVESDASPGKLTLEFVPSDDVASAMPQGEYGDTGKTFSLMSSEEQKGAALLDRQLQDKGTQELTKNIRFVLKDNKEGEIKLILKPEALGKVRINLNLNENNIVGKIIVENNSVRQVFMNNLADLTKALEDSGFGSASLDVSVGGGQTEGGSQYRDEKPVFFTSNAIDEMDGHIPVIYEDGINMSQINLVV